jgi:hypothetical protein
MDLHYFYTGHIRCTKFSRISVSDEGLVQTAQQPVPAVPVIVYTLFHGKRLEAKHKQIRRNSVNFHDDQI